MLANPRHFVCRFQSLSSQCAVTVSILILMVLEYPSVVICGLTAWRSIFIYTKETNSKHRTSEKGTTVPSPSLHCTCKQNESLMLKSKESTFRRSGTLYSPLLMYRMNSLNSWRISSRSNGRMDAIKYRRYR